MIAMTCADPLVDPELDSTVCCADSVVARPQVSAVVKTGALYGIKTGEMPLP